MKGCMWSVRAMFKREGIPFKTIQRGSATDARFGVRTAKVYIVPQVDVINEP